MEEQNVMPFDPAPLSEDNAHREPRHETVAVVSMPATRQGAVRESVVPAPGRRVMPVDRLTLLNKLLDRAMDDASLAELLDFALEIILGISGLPEGSRGVIFLASEPGGALPAELQMTASRGLAQDMVQRCQSVPFGRCACGLAAQQRSIVRIDFRDCDESTVCHDVTPEGHYCLPILRGHDTLGVLTLYTPPGYRPDQQTEEVLLGTVSTVAGIIYRKKMELELRRQAQVLDHVHGAVLTVDRDGIILDCNPAAITLFSTVTTPISGHCLSELFHGQEGADFTRRLTTLLAEKRTCKTETTMCRLGGHAFYAGVSASMLTDDEGQDCGMVLYVMDITREKQLEQKKELAYSQNRELTKRLINVQEHEYRAISRELHDELGQALVAIRTEAALIEKRSENSDQSIHESSMAVGLAVDHIYDVVHELMRRLRPQILDELGLTAAVEALIRDWRQRRPHIPCVLAIEGEFSDIDDEICITAYRMVQECMTNVLRHSAATRIVVMLQRQQGESGREWVDVAVGDNGRGMDPERMNLNTGRFGLLGLRERVEGLAGSLVLSGAPGEGLEVLARIPLDRC